MAKGKVGLHSRNRHRGGYDFSALTECWPELKPFLTTNKRGEPSINFHDPAAVKCLNQALLLHHYDLEYWDIPDAYLCPAVPGRADYLHHLADLLAEENTDRIPKGKQIKCLDIGTGANLIYPIIGSREYGWSFVGSEVDKAAKQTAHSIIERNRRLGPLIELRAPQTKHILNGVLTSGEYFDLVLCNPPFYGSAQEAMAENRRKQRGLKVKSKPQRNFSGQANELWFPGGEKAFIGQLIQESTSHARQCYWFTSLVAKESHLKPLVKQLEQLKATKIRTVSMAQGNKTSRFLAWTFLQEKQRKAWRSLRW